MKQRFFGFIRMRLTPDEKFGLHLTIGVFLSVLFTFIFFGIVKHLAAGNSLGIDMRIINLVETFRSPFLNKGMLFITQFGKWEVALPIVALIAFILAILKRWHSVVALILSVGGGELFVALVKHIMQRPRPPIISALSTEDGFSFPSGHAFVAFSFYGLLGYFAFRASKNKRGKIGVIAITTAIILAIGFSRIYLGAHWPSDVLASYASGAAWLTMLITALEIRRKSKTK